MLEDPWITWLAATALRSESQYRIISSELATVLQPHAHAFCPAQMGHPVFPVDVLWLGVVSHSWEPQPASHFHHFTMPDFARVVSGLPSFRGCHCFATSGNIVARLLQPHGHTAF